MIYRALQRCGEMIKAGEQNAAKITEGMSEVLRQVPALQVEYVSIVDAESLEPCDRVRGQVLVAVAARLGSTRLIDNIRVDTTVK